LKVTTHAGYATILQQKFSAWPDVAGVLYDRTARELSAAEMLALAAMWPPEVATSAASAEHR